MASTFMGLSIASRGLAASKIGLSVTANNTSNVNTTGYSRQVVNQSAAGPSAVYSGRLYVGAGAQVDSVLRVRDFRLDQKYWQENSSLGKWETQANYLQEIESILGEPSSSGFTTTMDEFYGLLETLSTNPGDSAARTALQQAGAAVAVYLNDASQRLTQLRSDVNVDVKTTVTQINSYTQQIAELNQRITTASAAGSAANELKDQRDALIDELAKLAGIRVSEIVTGTQSDGTETKVLSITVDGSTLVNGDKARQLEAYTITDGSAQNGLYGIRWKDTGASFDPGDNGSLKALLDMRDSAGSDSKGIPCYISQLDEFARTFAKAFNEGIYKGGASYYGGHAGGVGLDGSTGIRFFSFDGLSSADLMASGAGTDEVYANITAANISLSQDVLGDINTIAAASAAGGDENNENINDLISIVQDSRMFNSGTPEDFMNSIIATLGTSSAYAQRQNDNQTTLVKYISGSRSSLAGVSTNEETANMTKYQQAYDASAQMVTVWNQIYATTINMVSSD
ncbi:flagellar hook-associated protein FlgK [Acetonema longum]|uniref:Flagellar hook-associated protein 1 n=1 Tax=Acetonema longum DSM 6540 TaxID=1009370 RepID=F7NH07_9FIRM|nr:flagellar hook-associated protein FlgK [Acetonema longum]EGO64738.1 flagellar hook-associated protein FlgK [Acetonema longum DSM 6540]